MRPELAEVQRWLDKAEHHRTANAALASRPPITDTAAFHVQQTAEKLLKAYLVWKRTDFEKIHDLRSLIEQCAVHDAAFLVHRDSISPLTAFAVRFRYPGPHDPTVAAVTAALKVIDKLKSFIVDRLPTGVRWPEH